MPLEAACRLAERGGEMICNLNYTNFKQFAA